MTATANEEDCDRARRWLGSHYGLDSEWHWQLAAQFAAVRAPLEARIAKLQRARDEAGETWSSIVDRQEARIAELETELERVTKERGDEIQRELREEMTREAESARLKREARLAELEGALLTATVHDVEANRYHQSLGARWMCEAIAREARTTFRLNRNFVELARELADKWSDLAYWRPDAPAETR